MASTSFNWQHRWKNYSACPARDHRETWSLPYPVTPTETPRAPKYVVAPSTYMGWRKLSKLGHGKFLHRGQWKNVELPKDGWYGHCETLEDRAEPLFGTEERCQHVNVKPSRFLMTIASATESARLRGEKVAALRPNRQTVSPVDRSALLEYLQKTLDEAAVLEVLEVCSSVEICHPKPQTLHHGEFDPCRLVASSYLTCAGAEAVWDWLGNDEVVEQRFEAHEAWRRSIF